MKDLCIFLREMNINSFKPALLYLSLLLKNTCTPIISLLFMISTIALVGQTVEDNPISLFAERFNILMARSDNNNIANDNASRSITWDVRMDLSGETGAADYVVFGEAPDANDSGEPDEYDQPKPPAPMQPYVRAWFDDGLPEPYTILLKDYRKLNSKNYKEWNLTIHWMPLSNIATNVNVSWDPTDFDDSNFEYDSVILYDESNSVEVDMLINSYYNFILNISFIYSIIISLTDKFSRD